MDYLSVVVAVAALMTLIGGGPVVVARVGLHLAVVGQ